MAMPLRIMLSTTNHGRAESKPGNELLSSTRTRNGKLLFPEAIEVLSVSFPSTYQPAKAGIGVKNVHVVVMWWGSQVKVPRTTSLQLGYT